VILLRSAIPVDGAYQIALRFDRRVADLLEFSITGTAAEGAGFASSLVGSDDAGDYASLGVLLLDLNSGAGRTIAPGVGIPIARVRFRPVDPSIPQVPLAFERGVAGPVHAPARNLVVLRDGNATREIIPTLAPAGAVTVARIRMRGVDRTGAPGGILSLPVVFDSTLPVRGLRCGFQVPGPFLEFLGADPAPALGSACLATVTPGPNQGHHVLDLGCGGPAIPAAAGVTVAILRVRIVEREEPSSAWPERTEVRFDGSDPIVRPATPDVAPPYADCAGIPAPALPIGICIAPRARIQASPATGYAPLPVRLQDRSLGAVRSRSWFFGDGSTLVDGPADSPHTFGPGRFRAELHVRNDCGEDRAETAIESRIRVQVRPSADGPADDPPGQGHRPGERGILAARFDVEAGPGGSQGIIFTGLRLRKRAGGEAEGHRWVARASVAGEGGGIIAEGEGFGADGALRLRDRITREHRIRVNAPGRYRVEIDLATKANAGTAGAGLGPIALFALAGAIASRLVRATRIRRAIRAAAIACAFVLVLAVGFAGCGGGGGGGGGAPVGPPAAQGAVALELAWDGVEWETEAGLADAASLSLPCALIRVLEP